MAAALTTFSPGTNAQLVSQLGSPEFPPTLLTALNTLTEINHLSLVHLEASERVTYVFSASNNSSDITQAMQQLYLSIYYRLDPNMAFLMNSEHPVNDDIQLKRLQPHDIEDRDYYGLWYETMGIVDRVSVLTPADKGLYCLNLFRTQQPFTDNDLQTLDTLKPLLSALALKQARLSGTLSAFMTREARTESLMTRLGTIEPGLTQREKEVCARILLGMSSEGIGLDLDIKKQSVLTYRKRAYARLNISSQNELFGLCLTAV